MQAKIGQFRYESDSWKRLLAFISFENAQHRNMLAEVIHASKNDEHLLERAEEYQNYYLQQDTLLALLKNDIYSFDKLIQKEQYFDGAIVKDVFTTQKKLRDEMDKIESEFVRNKRSFTNFLDAYN